jgi:hypothetical protein
MNNVVEYSIIIELLHDAISHGVRSLEVLLDSQLVICLVKQQLPCVRPYSTPTIPTGTNFGTIL